MKSCISFLVKFDWSSPGLYFCFCVDVGDNNLMYLEAIHNFVEVLNEFFHNVCELDLVFNFYKVGVLCLNAVSYHKKQSTLDFFSSFIWKKELWPWSTFSIVILSFWYLIVCPTFYWIILFCLIRISLCIEYRPTSFTFSRSWMKN